MDCKEERVDIRISDKDSAKEYRRISTLLFNIIRQEFSFLYRWEMNCKKNVKNTCSAYENML